MKNILFTFLIFVTVVASMISCKNSIDRTDVYSVGDAIHRSFAQKDTSIINQFYNQEKNKWSEHYIEEMNELITPKLKYIKIDTTTTWIDGFLHSYIRIFYLIDSSYYEVIARYDRDSLINVKSLFFDNITEGCEFSKSIPYCPSNKIKFKSISWHYNYKTFTDATIEIQNNTGIDIDYIKFRVKLYNGSNSWNRELFFNQTVVYNEKIFKDDIVRINVPSLTNFYTGFYINNNNISFNAELIEILPKPIPESCELIEQLKLDIKTNKK